MNDSNVTGGISFLGALFLVFLVLKLTGTISWSWWWVTCPLWALPVLFGSIFLITVAAVLTCTIMDRIRKAIRNRKNKKKNKGQVAVASRITK